MFVLLHSSIYFIGGADHNKDIYATLQRYVCFAKRKIFTIICNRNQSYSTNAKVH